MRPIIYQLFVRHFSNPVTTGVPMGSLEQNGSGTFNGITHAALEPLAQMGFTHIWLTGVLRHATQTAHEGATANPASIVKGIAGSPYAVTDYFSLDPDLASSSEAAMGEFKELLQRIRHWGMEPLMDFIPNHVSRNYHSPHGESLGHSLGQDDNKDCFFAPDNAFYYLEGREENAPLQLPDGIYPPEATYGRVTGNNAATWTPSAYDWYETIKLNYGLDYRAGAHAADHLPGILSPTDQVPQTWRAMDAILAFWQELGVAGFRCDMAHMIPMAFWRWAIARCRVRNSRSLLLAEGYNDHMKLCHGDVHEELLAAGFDAVYDAQSYEFLRGIYEKDYWANDFDGSNRAALPLYQGGVRYLENHDEPRLCSPSFWGGQGGRVGRALMLAQYASSSGPILFYNGQEFGEKADGPSGYGGDNGRSSIFDYTCLPQLQQWRNASYNTAALSPAQQEQQHWIAQVLCLMQDPAFSQGVFYGLNWGNMGSPKFGRSADENNSGHYCYAYLRHHAKTQSTYLVVCNLRPEGKEESITVTIPQNAQDWSGKTGKIQHFSTMLADKQEWQVSPEQLIEEGLTITLPAGHATILRWESR